MVWQESRQVTFDNLKIDHSIAVGFDLFVDVMNLLEKCNVATDKQGWMPLNVTEPGKLHIALVEDIKSGAPYAITFQGYSDGCQYVEQLKPVPISAIVCGINDRCIEGQPLLHVITMLRELPRPFVLYFRLQDGQTKAAKGNNKFVGFKATQKTLKTKGSVDSISSRSQAMRHSTNNMPIWPNAAEATIAQKKAWKKLQVWKPKDHKKKQNVAVKVVAD